MNRSGKSTEAISDQSMKKNCSDQTGKSDRSIKSAGQYVAPIAISHSHSGSSSRGINKGPSSGIGSYKEDEDVHTSLPDDEELHRQSSMDSIQLQGRHRPSQFEGASRLVHSKPMKPKISLRDSVNRVMTLNRVASLIREGGNDGEDKSDNENEIVKAASRRGHHEKEIQELKDRVAPEKEVLELWREVAKNMKSG